MSAQFPVTPVDAADIAAFDHETDVLIVGYGCAGASAALEADAAECGLGRAANAGVDAAATAAAPTPNRSPRTD